MLFTVITGFVVGVFFEQAQPVLETGLERVGLALEEGQFALVTLAICLAAASALLALIGVLSYPVLLCLSAACGIARKPILARINSRK